MRACIALLVTVAFAVACSGSSAEPAAPPSLARMVGQLLLVRMRGDSPSPRFLARVRRGEIGGVVLFGDNFGPGGPGALVKELQQAAAGAGQPRLLIAIDQEGGIVHRLPGPPTLAPPQMTNARIAESQGRATGRALRRYGINVDLAPVLDVGRGGFITSRAFGATPLQVTHRAVAFARGLAATGVAATGKHFPGLGYAATNTDNAPTIVRTSAAKLIADLLPYRRAIADGLKLVMVSTAVYPKLAADLPAACSSSVVTGLLRRQLGFHGVVITDDLRTPGVNDFLSTPEAAVTAIGAGVDMVLAAGVSGRSSDRASESTYAALLLAAAKGTLPRSEIAAAYARVTALKRTL